ncbi:MAG: cohesin domain-containing protein, partial [Vicinamibacterales bacterium]|nr:cohesin domain-containing protein [Vicinamibacterales bacterium]
PPPAPAAAAPPVATPQVPPGSSAIPGTTLAPAPPAPEPPSAVTVFPPPPEPSAPAPAEAGAAAPPAAPAGPAPARIAVTPPIGELTVGGGPYTVPVSVTGAQGLTTITVSLSFNPAVLRVRSVQEGTFMRQGGVNAAFSQQVDAATGRIDLVITRTGDETGATGGGLLAAVLFDAVAPGSSPVATSGVATGPGGETRPLQFAPVTVTVR